ncbi:MAG: hypothetical protein QM749_16615 [Aquabacterium sp.]
MQQSLQHFVSRRAADIEGIGEALIAELVERERLKTPATGYTLEVADVAALYKAAEVAPAKVIDAIAARRTLPLARFVYALGIPQVGETTASYPALHLGVRARARGAAWSADAGRRHRRGPPRPRSAGSSRTATTRAPSMRCSRT